MGSGGIRKLGADKGWGQLMAADYGIVFQVHSVPLTGVGGGIVTVIQLKLADGGGQCR